MRADVVLVLPHTGKKSGVIIVYTLTNPEELNHIRFLYLDFSAVVNTTKQVLDELMNVIVQNAITVIISSEFHKNYEIVSGCSNEEQMQICQKAFIFLDELEKKDLLVTLEDVYDIRDVFTVSKRITKVGFVFYYISECFEALREIDGNAAFVSIVIQQQSVDIYRNISDALHGVHNDIDKDTADDSYFELPDFPKENTLLETRDTVLTMTEEIASGGEGEIFRCNYQNNYVVKIYHNGQLNILRLKKLAVMENTQIRYDGICWPERIVYLESGEPAGYLMKKIEGKPLSVVFDSYESILKLFPEWKKTDLIDLCIKILYRVQYLHLFGIIIGDLRMDNILIDSLGNPTLVDLDSCQIKNLPSPTGFGEFTAPELQKVTFKNTLRTYRNESFSCCVLVFKILFCGLHPYDQRFGADTIEEEIAQQSFPYSLDVHDDFSRVVFGGYDHMWKNTPYQMQKFFSDIFKSNLRPNIITIIMMLETYKAFVEHNESSNKNLNKIIWED